MVNSDAAQLNRIYVQLWSLIAQYVSSIYEPSPSRIRIDINSEYQQ